MLDAGAGTSVSLAAIASVGDYRHLGGAIDNGDNIKTTSQTLGVEARKTTPTKFYFSPNASDMIPRGGPGAMNHQSRSTSFSTSVPPNQRAARRPSVSSRFSYAVSIAEQGEAQTAQGAAAQHQIEEEIAQIKRYEVS